jgi:hypothetical protein
VLIPKIVKVLCFEALLQVLILKGFRIAPKLCKFGASTKKKKAAEELPLIGTECYLGSILQRVEMVVKQKDEKNATACAICVAGTASHGAPLPQEG